MRLCVLLLTVALCHGLEESRDLKRIIGLVDSLRGVPSEEVLAADNAALEEEIKAEELDYEDNDNHGSYGNSHHKPPPHPPVITVPIPTLPPLPSLPPLPPLPALPGLLGPKETIIATKTLYAEVTKEITRHPVCMTVYGVKPPCLPAELHAGGHGPHCWKRDNEDLAVLWNDEQGEGLYIEPTAAVKIPSVSATAELQEPKNLKLESSREGRYIEFRKETPKIQAATTNVDYESTARLLNLYPETQTTTKTLWVTRVQKVTDYRVTATLEAKNCVPTDLKIPFCQAPPPPPPTTTPQPPPSTTKPPPQIIIKPPHYVTTKPPYYGYKPPSSVGWKEEEKSEPVADIEEEEGEEEEEEVEEEEKEKTEEEKDAESV
ncbi:proteoglycan 4-like [Periplaneta americana]|uniref:proteoglycan 4-like n=1 Tax=Periplaneta americana TaxID=6978 RepID=UPI0037E85571